jgi:hypothetical protein
MLNSKNSDSRGRTRAENAEFVIAHIKALGLSPNPQSRLMQMYSVLTKAGGIIPPDSPDFDTALEAERDLQVLGFVFEQTVAHPSDAEFQRLVKNVLKDSLLPHEDHNQSKGRDAQFELFVAAICQNAGMLPVAHEEPDVTCHVGDIKFGIAAKRIKNTTKLEKHIRKAADQIKIAKLPGIITLDTCIALNPHNERVTTPIPDEQFGPLYSKAIKRFIDNHCNNFRNWVRGRGARGIVIHDQQVRFRPNGEWALEGMTMFVNFASKNNRRKRDFAIFAKQYKTGLPNVTHL